MVDANLSVQPSKHIQEEYVALALHKKALPTPTVYCGYRYRFGWNL